MVTIITVSLPWHSYNGRVAGIIVILRLAEES
jgi:hypothetical protein